MDFLLKVGPVKGHIHLVLRILEPFIRSVVLLQHRIAVAQREPWNARAGQHAVQTGGQQLDSVDSRAVIDQLGALVALGALLGDVCLPRQHVVTKLLPVALPVGALLHQRFEPTIERGYLRRYLSHMSSHHSLLTVSAFSFLHPPSIGPGTGRRCVAAAARAD